MAPQIVVLGLVAALLAPLSAHAAPTPAAAPDPCIRTAELTTRDQILAAVPANDEAWAAALRRRGIAKEENGWMQYIQGGSATASNRAFIVTFEDYCTARMRASIEQKRARPAPTAPQAAPPAPQPDERQVLADKKAVEVAQTKTATATSALSRFAAMLTPTKEEPPAQPTAAQLAAECQMQRDLAATCEAAGMGPSNNLPSDFKCRRAIAAAKSCTAP
jgi:hypothetical protein